MMWIDTGIILLLTLRTTLFNPGPRRPLGHDHEASPPVRGNEENLLRQGESDDCSLFAEVLHLQTKMAAITYLCNAEFSETTLTSSCAANIISHKVRLRVREPR
jgi:hypothetical protein